MMRGRSLGGPTNFNSSITFPNEVVGKSVWVSRGKKASIKKKEKIYHSHRVNDAAMVLLSSNYCFLFPFYLLQGLSIQRVLDCTISPSISVGFGSS